MPKLNRQEKKWRNEVKRAMNIIELQGGRVIMPKYKSRLFTVKKSKGKKKGWGGVKMNPKC